MKKNQWRYIVLAAVLLFTMLAFVACGKTAANKIPKGYNPSADVNPFLVEYKYATPEILIDGALDDDEWKNLSSISYSGDTTATAVKAFYGEEGIYFGVEVSDPDLAKNSSVLQSSSIEIYLDALNTDETTVSENHTSIHVSAAGGIITRKGEANNWKTVSIGSNNAVAGNVSQSTIKHATRVDGTYNDTSKDKGYVVELFIPYQLLGDDADMECGVSFATIECAGGARVKQARFNGIISRNPSLYWTFYRDTNSIEEYRKTNYAKYQVDGKSTDAIWKNRTSYYFANGNVGVSNYFAEEGLYLFFEIKDDKVYADKVEGSGKSWDDCILIYLDSQLNGGNAPQTDDVYLVIDAEGNIIFYRGNGEKWTRDTTNNVFAGIQIVNGKLNGKADGYCMEVFLPWTDFEMTSAPGTMGVNFAMRDWDGVITDGVRENTWYGTGCATTKPSEYIKMKKSYITGSAPASEIVLDGVLNDELWKSSKLALFFGSSAKIRWIWTDIGCYVAFDVTDSNIVTDASESNPNMNTSIQLYLDDKGDGGKLGDGNLLFIVDAAGRTLAKKPKNGSYVSASSGAQGGASLTKSGYCVEMYIPWNEFDGGKPEKMGVAFGQNAYLKGKTSKTTYTDEYCKNPNLPILYSVFTQKGIEDSSDVIVYDASKFQGKIGLGAWRNGACFKNLEIVTKSGTKKYSLADSAHADILDFYKKDEAKTGFSITANGLYAGTEDDTNAFKKAILKEESEVKGVSVDFYPVEGKMDGCLYLGVQGVVSSGTKSNPAVCFRLTDTNADSGELTLTVSELADSVTFKKEQISTLYTQNDAQAIRMSVQVSGTKAIVTLRSLSDTTKVETIEIDLNDYK